MGRERNIPRAQRLCKKCRVLDDEFYFFLYYDVKIGLRSKCFVDLKDSVPSVQHLDVLNKLKQILNPTPELVRQIGVYNKQSLELRGPDPCQTNS